MLRFIAMAVVGGLSAAGAAQAVISLDARSTPAEPTAMFASAPTVGVASAPAAASVASVVKAADGHYWAEALVNGSRVRFLVDTGASAVALTGADARRLGLNPATLDYRYTVQTANGEARAAAVKLASVAVAGARVQDVEALVIDQGLETSLLGMTYLGRLSRFEATRDSLILRP